MFSFDLTVNHYWYSNWSTVTPRIMSVQYCGGCSVLRGDSISTAEAVQYCWGIASVLRGDSISTAEG